MQWLWRCLTYDRGARLIAGDFVEVDDPASAPRDRLRRGEPSAAARDRQEEASRRTSPGSPRATGEARPRPMPGMAFDERYLS